MSTLWRPLAGRPYLVWAGARRGRAWPGKAPPWRSVLVGSSSWGLVCCVGQQVRPEAPVCLLGRAIASHGLSDQLAVSLRTGAKERSSVRRPQGARFWVCLGPHLPVMPRDGCGGCRLGAGVLRNCCPSLCRGTQGARAPHWGRRPEGLSPPPRRDPERHRWSRLPGGGQGRGGRGEAAGVAAAVLRGLRLQRPMGVSQLWVSSGADGGG